MHRLYILISYTSVNSTRILCVLFVYIYRYLHINEQRFDVRLQTEYS